MIQACGMVLDSMKHIFWVGIPLPPSYRSISKALYGIYRFHIFLFHDRQLLRVFVLPACGCKNRSNMLSSASEKLI